MNEPDLSIPADIVLAAQRLEYWFKARGHTSWKLCGLQSRTDQPAFDDATRIARACLANSQNSPKEFRNGIGHIISALDQAAKSGLSDPQVAALWKMGGEK